MTSLLAAFFSSAPFYSCTFYWYSSSVPVQCKHDFCWVCLEAWKKHSTATGGYFRCNRYEVVKKVEESHDQMMTEVVSEFDFTFLKNYGVIAVYFLRFR